MKDWTAKKFLKYSKEYRKKFNDSNPGGSKSKKLFKPIERWGNKDDMESYIFQKDNWNDADLLRSYIHNELEGKGICKKDKELDGGQKAYIFFSSCDDSKKATIIIFGNYQHDTYEIYWYKNRGNTENIMKNGQEIFLTEYVTLLNILDIEPA